MVRIRRSTVVDAPLDAVWQVLRDFNGHERWHPAVETSQIADGKLPDQIGAVRDFRLTGGERVKEMLLGLSDREHSFRYAITEADIPLQNYVSDVQLKPVTDGNRTFWNWSSHFDAPPGRERELTELVSEGVYEAGFQAIRRIVEGKPRPVPQATAAHLSAASDTISGEAVVVDRHGGPEVLRPCRTTAAAPAAGQVRIRQAAIGVNYIDVYCRTGTFDLLDPPAIPGMEAAGTVIDTGPGVTHLSPGQRVAYACPPVGAYAAVRTMDAALVVPLPEAIGDETAAAGLLKGVTAEFLLHTVHKVEPGDIVLIFAPAGGVGRLLCQWANHLGARVIGATSSAEKARIARTCGAHEVILPGDDSLEAQVMALTGGHGADVIYDAVGRDSFAHSVAALATCGHLVSYGQASGDIGLWDIASLASRSATISRPNYGHYTDTLEKLARSTSRLFDMIDRGVLDIEIGQRFALDEAAEAHRALESRRTTGSTILIPETANGGSV